MTPTKRELHQHLYYFLVLTAISAVLISCDFSTLVMPQQVPTAAPGAVDTIVVQTAAAASTQTAALIPPTMTPSFTPLPTWTASITPSPTVTFVFKLSTPTKIPPTRTLAPTKKSSGGGGGGSGGGGGGGSGKNYDCNLTAQTPVNGSHFNPGDHFTVNWTVENAGSTKWVNTTVDLVFVGGTNLSSAGRYDLTTSVDSGGSTVLSINMVAPGGSGSYLSNWELQAGSNEFCGLGLNIVVP